MSDVLEVRVVIHATETQDIHSGYWVGVSGKLSESFNVKLPLNSSALADLRWYLEEYLEFHGAGDQAKARDIEQRMQGWGNALFHSVLGSDESTQINDLLRQALQAGGKALLTLESDNSLVLGQPWEMMRNESGPLVFQGISIRRQIQSDSEVKSGVFELPLRVLLIVSRPDGTGFIDPRNSIRAVFDALELLGENVQTAFCEPPTLERLAEVLQEARARSEPFQIVHFDGHGYYDEENGQGGLCFENEWNTAEYVEAGTLGKVLREFDVPLVILEACRGSSITVHPPDSSLAPALLGCGVRSVVAFSHNVHVEATRILASRFYGELVLGARVGQALEMARRDLHNRPVRWLRQSPKLDNLELLDWFIPQLYQSGFDLKLVAGSDIPVRAFSPKESDTLESFPQPPMYSFHGRARELLQMERAYRKNTAVAITGMGGMGKTALAREAAAWWKRTGRITEAVFFSFEQRAGVERAIQQIGEALDGRDFIKMTPEAQRLRAVELFRLRKVLVIWDNFESTLARYQTGVAHTAPFCEKLRAELVCFYNDLVSGSPEGKLLVTCRTEEMGLPKMKIFELAGLARTDSLHLLASILDVSGVNTERPGYERHAIHDLLQALSDHPLSVELIAPHLRDMTPEAIRGDFGALLDSFKNVDADQDRNKSLLASLRFSTSRLSTDAQVFLPFLKFFEFGVFEQRLANIAGVELKSWQAVRAEFMSLTIVRINVMEFFAHRYITLHPTLQMLSFSDHELNDSKLKSRYIKSYLSVAKEIRQVLKGNRAIFGMKLASLEEANLWRALRYAFECEQNTEGSAIAEVLGDFLSRSGRLRESMALANWIAQVDNELNQYYDPLRAKLEYAKRLADRGEVEKSGLIIAEIDAILELDSSSKDSKNLRRFAICNQTLGRRYMESRQFARALTIMNKSMTLFEQAGETEHMDLVAALVDRGYVYYFLASYANALADAKHARGILLRKEETSTLPRVDMLLGDTLRCLHRFEEAEKSYNDSLAASVKHPDSLVRAATLQKLGGLHSQLGRKDMAKAHLRESLRIHEIAGNREGEMQTSDQLGSVCRLEGDFKSARAWYSKARAMAKRRKAFGQLVITTNNLSSLYLDKALLMPSGSTRDIQLRKGLKLAREAMSLQQDLDSSSLGATHSTMGAILRELRDFGTAEYHLKSALKIHIRNGALDVLRDYKHLEKLESDWRQLKLPPNDN